MSQATVSESSPLRTALLRWLPGVFFTALAVWLLSRLVDWRAFWDTLTSIPIGILLLAVVIYLVGMLMRGVAWQLFLQRKVSAQRAVLALNQGYFFNNILPFRIGELARAYLLGRSSGLGTLHVLSTIVVERSVDLLFAAGLLLATLPLALEMAWARPLALLLLVLIVAALLIVFFAAQRRAWVEERIQHFAGRSGFIRRWILPQVHNVLSGFSVLTRPEFFLGGLALLGSSWLIAIFRDWMLIRVFVPDAPLWWAALGISAANMMGAVPAMMGALGTYELGGTSALTLVGMPGEAALAYILVTHVTHLVFSTLIGAFAVSQEGQTVSELVQDIRRAK